MQVITVIINIFLRLFSSIFTNCAQCLP